MEPFGTVPPAIACHACGGTIDLASQEAFTHIDCPQCGAISIVPVKFGGYLLLHPLGEGGVGTVYKAMDLALNRLVALKILRKKLANNPSFIENFSREAHAAASVNHPNVAQVYSFDSLDGQYYLAMEVLENGSLDDQMSELGMVPETDTLIVGIAAARGLQAAHQRGMLHRDVKPGNIMYDATGTPKIVDFGLARPPSKGTAGGKAEPIWGTPYYIAPEKLRGQPEDIQSDIYSLGATLFHAMAGRPPYDGETAWQVASKHASQPAVSLKSLVPTIHTRTAEVIGRMLAKNPADRYAQYDDLIRDLSDALEAAQKPEDAGMIVTAGGERIAVKSAVITACVLVGILVTTLATWYFWPRAGSGETATNNGQATNTNQVTVVPVNTAEVDFNRLTPTGARPDWLLLWDAGCVALGYGEYGMAVAKFEESRKAAIGLGLWEQWINFYLGLAHCLDTRERHADAARGAFQAALRNAASTSIPAEITTDNFLEPLAALMLDKIPAKTFADAETAMPPWARALSLFCRAVKQQQAHDFEGAATLFDAYTSMELGDADRWAGKLRTVATSMSQRNREAQKAMDRLSELLQTGDEPRIRQWIETSLTKPPLPELREAMERRRPGA